RMDPRSWRRRDSLLAGAYARRTFRAPAYERRRHGVRVLRPQGGCATAEVRRRAQHGEAPAAAPGRAHARSAEGSRLQRSRDPRLRGDGRGAFNAGRSGATHMNFAMTDEQQEIERAVESICKRFNDEYWRHKDAEGGFPHDFHKALAEAGWLGVAMPAEFGGAGLGI